jgi:hypothetical protein
MPKASTLVKWQTWVADQFQAWLKQHPKATREEKVAKFNDLCDEILGR